MCALFFAKGKVRSGPEGVTEVSVDSVALSPRQPRETFEKDRLGELAASIREHGVIQPILVRPVGNAYELVAGECRLRAARLAGLKRIPAVVREMTEPEMAVLALAESLQREGLNVIEEARGYRRLVEEHKVTQAQIGQMVGRSQSTIANKLRLLRLPASVQERILGEGVSERHARALLELPDESWQNRILDEIRERGLSVRETEERVKAIPKPPDQRGLFDNVDGKPGPTRRGSGGFGPLGQVSDRRAIRAFRDVRLFLNTFRRAVEMLREAGVPAEMSESDGPDFVEVKVLIPKIGGAGPRGDRPADAAGRRYTGRGERGRDAAGAKSSPAGRG